MSSNMSPEKWAEVEAAFDRLVELSPTDQASGLKQLNNAPEIRSEVESLLAQESIIQSQGLIITPEIPTTTATSGLLHRPGDKVDDYELLYPVAQNLHSEVWCADKFLPNKKIRVALKFLRANPLDAAFERRAERFRNEAHILSQLKHPNIARLMGAGQTGEGLLYLAIEWIDGVPINEFSDSKQLSIRKRVELLIAAAEAIAYAHRFLVVHRDIKPDNILVDESGKPFVLDFGISKILDLADLDPSLDVRNSDLTLTVERPMTPAYASPEQIKGKLVSTATDVYGLGLLAYEVLSGHHAYSERAQTEHKDLFDRASQGVPLKPSDVVTMDAVFLQNDAGPSKHRQSGSAKTTPEGLNSQLIAGLRSSSPESLKRTLKGKLDAIIGKALQKSPEQRYESVEAFNRDLSCWMENRPIAAEEERQTLTNLIRKYPIWSVAIASSAVIATALGLYGLDLGNRSANKLERDNAVAKAAESKQMVDYLLQNGNVDATPPSLEIEELLQVSPLLESQGRIQELINWVSNVKPFDASRLSQLEQIELAAIYSSTGKVTEGLDLLRPMYANINPQDALPAEYENDLRKTLGELFVKAGWPFVADSWIGSVHEQRHEIGDAKRILVAAEICNEVERYAQAVDLSNHLSDSFLLGQLNTNDRFRLLFTKAKAQLFLSEDKTEGWKAARIALGLDNVSLDKLLTQLPTAGLKAEILTWLSNAPANSPAEKRDLLKRAISVVSIEANENAILKARIELLLAQLYFDERENLDADFLSFAKTWSETGWQTIFNSQQWASSPAARLTNFATSQLGNQPPKQALEMFDRISEYRSFLEADGYLDLELLETELKFSLEIDDKARAKSTAQRFLELAQIERDSDDLTVIYALMVSDSLNKSDNYRDTVLNRLVSEREQNQSASGGLLDFILTEADTDLADHEWLNLYRNLYENSAEHQINILLYWAENQATEGNSTDAKLVGRLLQKHVEILNQEPTETEIRILGLLAAAGEIHSLQTRLDEMHSSESSSTRDAAAAILVKGLFAMGQTGEALRTAKMLAPKIKGKAERFRTQIWEIGNDIRAADPVMGKAWSDVSDLLE